VTIFGTTEQYLMTAGLEMDEGRFLTAADSAGGRPVCVIGHDVATNLFIRESPIGKKIRIGPRWLEVVGVLEKRGSFMGLVSMDNEAIIPVQQMLMGYWRNPDFEIQVKAVDLAHLEDAKEELRGALRKVRHVAPGAPDDFAINQQEQAIKVFNHLAGTIAAAGLAVTGLSLFVGGIGIMNIMYVSVAERTREIGVRKAIAAPFCFSSSWKPPASACWAGWSAWPSCLASPCSCPISFAPPFPCRWSWWRCWCHY